LDVVIASRFPDGDNTASATSALRKKASGDVVGGAALCAKASDAK
jgi:hypothetical protein